MPLTVIPLLADRMNDKFDMFEELKRALDRTNVDLQDGDILVISSKYTSNSEGRIIDLKSIKLFSTYSKKISKNSD